MCMLTQKHSQKVRSILGLLLYINSCNSLWLLLIKQPRNFSKNNEHLASRQNKLDKEDIQKMAISKNITFPVSRLDNFHVSNILLF